MKSILAAIKTFYIDAYCATYMVYAPLSKRPQGGGATLMSVTLYMYIYSALQIYGRLQGVDFLEGDAKIKITVIALPIYLFNILIVAPRVSEERRQEYAKANRHKYLLRLFFMLPVVLMVAGWFYKLWLPVDMWHQK